MRPLSTADAHTSLAHKEILYNAFTSDHIPLKMIIRFNNIPDTVKCTNDFMPWGRVFNICSPVEVSWSYDQAMLTDDEDVF